MNRNSENEKHDNNPASSASLSAAALMAARRATL